MDCLHDKLDICLKPSQLLLLVIIDSGIIFHPRNFLVHREFVFSTVKNDENAVNSEQLPILLEGVR